MVPPENVKAVPFEVRLHAGLDPPVVLRFINNTAALDMRLGSVWKANQDPPPADQLPLTIVLPNLHTKCQDELEQIASLIYYNPCSDFTQCNYFFKADGARREVTEFQSALQSHRARLDNNPMTWAWKPRCDMAVHPDNASKQWTS